MKRFTAAAIAATTVATVAVVAPAPAFAQKPQIVVPLGQTTVVQAPEGVDRVVVGDGQIADVIQLPGGRDILINGKKPGFTNFLVFLSRGGFRDYKLEVLSTRRDETVAVRVQVLEVTERKTGNVGVRWSESVGIREAAPSAPFKFGLPIRQDVLEARLNLLSQGRDVRVLAAPTLVIQNGKKGSFLSGGELPIPLAQNTGGGVSYSIEWKQFGIKLDCEPTLEGNDTITMNLRPEVSSIDEENAINLQNLSIPSLTTRWANTTVQLKSGESIVIAGLMRNEKFRVANKLPFIGDIPVIGYLFGNASYDERVSELVFVVSPTIINNNVVRPEQDYGSGKTPLGQPKK